MSKQKELYVTVKMAVEVGLSIWPPRQDGSKAPLGNSWKERQQTAATLDELRSLYRGDTLTGIGLICGKVSGNLECLDYDERCIFEVFKEAAIANGLGPLIIRIEGGYKENSPNGVHLLYQCEAISGNTKLATRPKRSEEMKDENDKTKTLIETRGEGGFVIIAPTFGTVNPSGSYDLVSGSLTSIATITPEERRDLFSLARTLHVDHPEKIFSEGERLHHEDIKVSGRPGDEFNKRAKWYDILTPHGWETDFRRGDVCYWRRPGKKRGISATTGHNGTDLFHCFTSSSSFEPNQSYTKFGAYAVLNHNGDFYAAAKDLAKQRYGDTTPTQKTIGTKEPEVWLAPQPFEAKIDKEPYPIDALPVAIRLAVEEVLAFVKAPIALVASAALSALSIAIQAHSDVMRAEKLSGPSSLFLLTIADSGERKSTCDGYFTAAIREYELAQAETAKLDVKRYDAEMTAWEAKYSGIKDCIRRLVKTGKPTTNQENALRNLRETKPEPPRVPRLIYVDTTPEALKYSLAKQWPSGAVVSSEAGIVFGSHSMCKDSAMRNFTTFNQLWDGIDLPTERRSSESFTVKGARLTMALQVQEATLRAFFKQNGELARGTGFLARFLIAWPESTQGSRPFTEAPENWPSLGAFNKRITALLNHDAPIDKDGALHPTKLVLAPDAKKAWIAFHDAIEIELASGGELFDVRDVASKTADNAARVAALFQMFDHGGGAVGLDAFDAASRIAAWHLNESRRFFVGLALPQELANAARLDTWLIEYCRGKKTNLVPINQIQQYGPGCLRTKAAIDAAVEELEGLERARLVKVGKRKTIHINPALLAGDI